MDLSESSEIPQDFMSRISKKVSLFFKIPIKLKFTICRSMWLQTQPFLPSYERPSLHVVGLHLALTQKPRLFLEFLRHQEIFRGFRDFYKKWDLWGIFRWFWRTVPFSLPLYLKFLWNKLMQFCTPHIWWNIECLLFHNLMYKMCMLFSFLKGRAEVLLTKKLR